MLTQVIEEISDLSSLTKVQLETLELHIAIRKGEINLRDALRRRKVNGISPGTHYRILSQARKNVKRSLLTVAIAAQLGLVKAEDVQRIISAISAIPLQVDSDKLMEIVALVSTLANRVVIY